jgi:uncharacterized protein
MTRAVVDTNIVVSAFVWGGNPRAILDAARQGTLTLFTSAALIAELEDVLARAKFAKRIADAGSSVDELLGDYLALAQLIRPTADPPAVALTLGSYRDIAILSIPQMLQKLSAT